MAEPIKILEDALLALPRTGRARLAHALLSSLATDPEADPYWASDVRQRVRDWRQGRLEALPLDLARAAIRERYGARTDREPA